MSADEQDLSGQDQSLLRRSNHAPHEWPQFDENYCSCCRSPIVHGLTNVVRIAKAPESILNLDGQRIGINKKAPAYKALLHDHCFKRHFNRQVSCEKCGGFSKILKLKDGSENNCICTCHTGSEFCSYVLEPNAKNKQPLY